MWRIGIIHKPIVEALALPILDRQVGLIPALA